MSKSTISYSIFTILFLSLFLSLFAQEEKQNLTVFSNNTPITINTRSSVSMPIKASLYPSTIDVSGMTGTITKLAVTLDGNNHTRPHEQDFLLVSPIGEKFVFLADSNGDSAINDKKYTFSDDGVTTIPFFIAPSGTYKPTVRKTSQTITFPAPAPDSPYNAPPNDTFASTFNGADPNGTWSLYAVEGDRFFTGSVDLGWSLTITTDALPMTFNNSSYIGFENSLAISTPYGTSINVSGESGVISDINVHIDDFSHDSPRDVDILLVSPNGMGLIVMSDVNTSNPASNANLIFDDSATVEINGNEVVTGTFKPTDGNNFSVDTFPRPAPVRNYHKNNGNQLSRFNGFSPNGEWRLFVVDDNQTNAGTIDGGWSLDITTTSIAPPAPTNCTSPSFSTATFPVGNSPTNLAVADFNNDMNPDLAVANQVSNNVSILPGNGDGTFAPQSQIAVGSSPYGIIAGKFNADNNFDIAVTNSGSNNISVLFGNGDGTFSAPSTFLVGSNPISIATGDFNNDTNADLVVANFGGFFTGTVSILLGNGSGGFTSGTSVRTRTQPSFVKVAKLDSDANDDIVVANFGADSVSTFLGNGSGSFQLKQNIYGGAGPVALDLADLGTDGLLDLVIASYNSDSIRSCPGNGDGTFSSCNSVNSIGANPISVAIADFTGDGFKSVASASSGANLVSILSSNVTVGFNPNDIETEDFNSDGKTDVVSVNFGSNDVSILINNCQVASGNLFDYNGDRRTDYAVFRPSTEEYYVESLNQASASIAFGRPDDKLVPADYNGDGRTDFGFYRPESGVWHIVERDSFGRVYDSTPIYRTQFGLEEDIPTPADYDGDGKDDIAVWRPSDGNWYVRRSTDNVTQIAKFGMLGDKPVVGDYDGDGKADLAVFRPSTGVWYIFRSTDSSVYIVQFGISEDKTVVGDYDGDGKDDIAVWRPTTGVWYVFKSSDNDFIIASFGLSGDIPVIGDFEGDGKYDFAVWRPTDGFWYVRKSSDTGTIFYPLGTLGDIPVPTAYVR